MNRSLQPSSGFIALCSLFTGKEIYTDAGFMLKQSEFQKVFNFNDVLIVVFNALLFDLLVIGYGGHTDLTKMRELLSEVTVGAFFESALIIAIVYVFYSVILKEPLIKVLSKIYFPVVLIRYRAPRFWTVGYEMRQEKIPFRTVQNHWKQFCRYQLAGEHGAATWTPMQHLSVATFFVFILSMISPWFGFQSLGYRLLPDILNQLGIPSPYHWLGGTVLVIAMCYLCSNGMLALFDGHRDGFRRYRIGRVNADFLTNIDRMLKGLGKMTDNVRDAETDYPPFELTTDSFKENLEEAKAALRELRSQIKGDLETDRSELFRDFMKNMGGNSDGSA